MAKVGFLVGTQAEYDASSKDQYTLYWITDTKRLYKGSVLYGVGAEATQAAAGLLSAEDKRKLDAIAAGSMRFVGVFPALDDVPAPHNDGDVIIVDTIEYIWAQNKWNELGHEGNYLTVAAAEATYLKKVDAEATYLKQVDAASIYETKAAIAELTEKLEKEIKTAAASAAGVTSFHIQSTDGVNGVITGNIGQNDMRIFIPADASFHDQEVGPGGDQRKFYFGMRVYAPDNDYDGCRNGQYDHYDEHFTEIQELMTDEAGRKYRDFWLPVAAKQGDGSWQNYATLTKYAEGLFMGFNYLIEWYKDNELQAIASKRINLVSTKDALYDNRDWATARVSYRVDEVEKKVQAVEGALTWGNIADHL